MEKDEVIVKNPNLDIAQLQFLLTKGDSVQIQEQIMEHVKENNMAPYYQYLCEQLKWNIDEELYNNMKSENEKKLQEIKERTIDAEENLGETEVRLAFLARAEYLSMIGDKKESVKAYRETAEKTVPLGQRMDIMFALIRIGFFFEDYDLISRNIEKAKSAIEEGGDWDRKNRLKVYEACYCMSTRNFSRAATLFLDTISTFTSYELFDYKKLIGYTVIMSLVALDRPSLKSKTIDAPEILSVIRDIPHLSQYLNSFYDSEYDSFFLSLAEIYDTIKNDKFLSKHADFYSKEMRIKAYTQLLESYKSVQIQSMAEAFGVSETFIDRELSRFIAGNRLHCKIDKVSGIVETTRPDNLNSQYQNTIRQGDLLLNRVQKLSRVINL
eukprot:TRINITY_DN3752_c0_g2_i7.p1 TRINITY_DN3752_c0_g2~~TRINITY_DN3752_c0_g2_i7.p1  ORF type:complete len:383 (+),score=122.01 TRINITY_DN3752_c0_g2_i7:96-1244(+)